MGEEDEEDQMMHIVTDMDTEDGLSMAITWSCLYYYNVDRVYITTM
jgi:hypothetical protein